MIDLRTVARPLLAAPFLIGAVNALRSAPKVAERSADVSLPIAEVVGLPKDPLLLVRLNAGAQLGAAGLLTLGRLPRIASLVLAASVVPTTLAGHRFWEQRDPEAKTAQLLQFAKNAGMLGGLVFAALDTGGRPSVLWAGRRAVGQAAHVVADTVSNAVSTAAHALPGGD